MNIRIAALALLLGAQAGFAQDYQAAKAKAAERSAMLDSLERGKEMKGSSGRYQLLTQVRAVALSSASETPQQALSRIGEGGAQVVETKGRLVLFRSAQVQPAVVRNAGGASVYPTALSARNATLGVLTGTLVVKPKNMADADAIATSHGLQKSKAYPQLQTVFYEVKPGADIADASAALQADPRVELAYPEIIEHVRVAK
jgi:hypothetical protein